MSDSHPLPNADERIAAAATRWRDSISLTEAQQLKQPSLTLYNTICHYRPRTTPTEQAKADAITGLTKALPYLPHPQRVNVRDAIEVLRNV